MATLTHIRSAWFPVLALFFLTIPLFGQDIKKQTNKDSAQQLKAVTVTARKDAIENDKGKLIYNVGNMTRQTWVISS